MAGRITLPVAVVSRVSTLRNRVGSFTPDSRRILTYDAAKGRVVANREITSPGIPIISFGEDEAGEAYFTIVTPNGQGIYRFVKAK